MSNVTGLRYPLSKMPSQSMEMPKSNSAKSLMDSYEMRHQENNSSASSCESLLDLDGCSRRTSLQDTPVVAEVAKEPTFQRMRSMSDGGTHIQFPNEEPFEVFPSLPDAVLEKMGLRGDAPRERLSEDDMEQKFVALSLAFTIDSATIRDRCERQRRYRDQTETNLMMEIERFTEKVNKLHKLCTDMESTDLLASLLEQIEIVMKASAHATISAERFGAVQHEERLAEAVHLMINHVNILKQQRDSARRQLQYTKRVLQDTNHNSDSSQSKQTKNNVANGRLITRRRASIATITQNQDINKIDMKKINRRISDHTLKTTTLIRGTRPTRLELGVDLVKIKEGTVEEATPCEVNSNQKQFDFDSKITLAPDDSSLRSQVKYYVGKLMRKIETFYHKLSQDGSWHEVFFLCSLLCFAFSIIIWANILYELKT